MATAFSLENLAGAAVESMRDATSIVKGFQDDEDNVERMDAFIGASGASKSGSKKTLAGALGKSKLKLGKRLGKALGKMKKETKEDKKTKKIKGGSIYKFGYGDGHYWDRWLTPARSAKHSLPDTGRASQSYIPPLSGFKRTNEQLKLATQEKKRKELVTENQMLDDHIEYATKNMGHVVHHKMFSNFEKEKMFSAFGDIDEDNDKNKNKNKNTNTNTSSSTHKSLNHSASAPATIHAAKLSHADMLKRHAIKGEIVKDHKFYEHYRKYEHKIHDESILFKHKQMHGMASESDLALHALNPDYNNDHHLTGSMLAFHDDKLSPRQPGDRPKKFGHLPPMVRGPEPIVQLSDDMDWRVKMYKSTIDLRKSGLLGVEVRRDLIPEPLMSRAISGTIKKMSKTLSQVEVDYEHFGLGDVRGMRLAQSLSALRDMTTLNLADNRLTQKSLVEIVNRLIEMGKEGKTSLENLNLSDNNLGIKGANSIHRMLITQPPINLITLQLSRVGLTDRQVEELVHGLIEVGNGIGAHSLQVIDVSHNKISSRGGVAFGQLLGLEDSKCQITELDLSWNVLSGKGAVKLGQALAGEDTLQKLNLAYNSFGKSGALSLGKALETNDTLSYLDLTSNNVGGPAAMVIAYGLSINEALETLIMDLNPIGEAGARSMLRLYAEGEEDTTLYLSGCNFNLERQQPPLEHIDLEDPVYIHKTDKDAIARINLSKEGVEEIGQYGESGSPREEGGESSDPCMATFSTVVKNAIDFEPNNPTGTYILDLEKPFERAISYLILELANKFPGFELHNIEHKTESGGSKTIPIGRAPEEDLNVARAEIIDTSTNDPWKIPEIGILTMVVSQQYHKPFPCVGIEDKALERMIIVMYGRDDAPTEERVKMLQMACMDMYFTATQANLIMSNIHAFEERILAASLLLPRILGDGEIFRENLSPGILLSVEKNLGNLFHFYPENPTGRYILNLSRESDRVVMKKLLEINTVDKNYSKYKSKHGDTSMHGDWSNFRNGLYKDKAVNLEIVFRNGIPEQGKVQVDYVSPRRCPRTSAIVTDEKLKEIITTLNFMEEFDDTVLMTKFLIPKKKPVPKKIKKKTGKWGKLKSSKALLGGLKKVTSPPKKEVVSPKTKEKEASPQKDAAAAAADSTEPPPIDRNDPEELKKLTFEYKLIARCKRKIELFKNSPTIQLERLINKMNQLKRLAAELYFTSEQVAEITCTIPIQFPTCRIAAIQTMFNRIVNFEHFYLVEDEINKTNEDVYRLQSSMLQERLGILNILNPNYVDRDFILRCEIYEDNKVGRLLVEYAVVEPGENWQNVTRQQNLMREPFPGWDLNVRFYPETLEKFDGTFFCLTYYSGADEDCEPIWPTRRKWMNQFLVADGDDYIWDEFDYTDIELMHKHYPKVPPLTDQDRDIVSALRTRNNSLLLARPSFEAESSTWHVF